MTDRLGKRSLLVAVGWLAVFAQGVPDWQTKAGGKMAFEVASVKPSKGEFVVPAFPFNAGDAYRPTGGYLRANCPLWCYIQFAYKLGWPAAEQQREIARLPKWVTTDPYSVDARAAQGNPTKDQMRLMVQSLLADRFQLAAHFETHEGPVLALTVVKAGTLGPKLISHADGPPCDPAASFDGPPAKGAPFPPICGSTVMLRKSGGALMLLGYRNAPMDMLADSLSTVLGHPVIDKTGLSGSFDFTLEWAPDPPPSDSAAAPPDAPGPTSQQALRDQLGLKVESTKGPVRILVVDHVERPSEN